MATETFVGTTVIETRGDTDWLRIHLTAGTVYNYYIPIPNGYYYTATLYSPGSVPVPMAVPYSNAGYFTVPTTGDYFFGIEAEGDASLPTSVSISSVNDTLPGAPFTTATIAVGQTLSIVNQYMINYNQDWFGVDLIAGQSYSLATSDPNTNGGSAGTTFFVDAAGRVVGSGQHFTAAASAHYFAAVAPSFNVVNYQFSLNAIADDHPDLIANAGSLTVGTSGGGTFETRGDLDWYAITLTANTSYTLALTTSQANSPSAIRVADAAGTILFSDPSGANSMNPSMTFTSTTAGTYYIGAYGGQFFSASSSTYTLSATVLTGDIPDNVSTVRQLVVGGSEINSMWQGNVDHDWFRVDLVQGQSYDFALFSSGIYLSLSLYDFNGVLVSTPPNDYSGPNLDVTAQTTGTYYVSANGVRAGRYSIAATTYLDDFADNASTTGRLTVNGSVTGQSELPNDIDWFAVDLLANRTYVLSGAAGALFDATGHALLTPGVGDLTYTPVTSGTYYVAASDYTGSYTASISEVFDDTLDNASTRGLLYQQFNGTDAADTLNGTAYPSQLNGLGGDDLLIGGASRDQLVGGDGNDVLYGGASDDSLNGGNDNDTLYGEAGADSLVGGNGNDFLYGGDDNDVLTANAGNDWLDGGAGADRMVGGAGDDTYRVDSSLDSVLESLNGGTDTVRVLVSAASYTLSATAEVERLIADDATATIALDLTGNAYSHDIEGNAGDNFLTGGSGADTLYGFEGNDYLIGGGGADTLVGGTGDDSYAVSDAATVVIEAAGEGYDTLKASVSYVLGDGVEIETSRLLGTENLALTGNTYAQVLIGNLGDNVLDGGGGGDRLKGRDGNDTYIIRHAGDTIAEFDGKGDDTVKATVSYVLEADVSIEHLTTLNAAATTAMDLTGNAYSHDIQGNAGVNVLTGGTGDDVLQGFGGDDSLFGGGGSDVFLFDHGTGQDSVGDFVAGTDKLDLSKFFSSFAQVQAATSDVGGNAVIDLGTGDTVTLSGVASGQLHLGDVILSGNGQTPAATAIDGVNVQAWVSVQNWVSVQGWIASQEPGPDFTQSHLLDYTVPNPPPTLEYLI